MGAEGRVRISSKGQAAMLELRALATRILDNNGAASPDDALDMAARFVRAVDPHERDRIVAALRRETGGQRLAFPAARQR